MIGFSDLKHHFDDELGMFLQTPLMSFPSRVKRPREEEIDVESISTASDALVTSSSPCSPVSTTGFSETSIQSFYNPRFPSEYNRSKGERWQVR